MAGKENKKAKQGEQQSAAPVVEYQVMMNCRVSIIGSKNFFSGLDKKSDDFDSMSEADQEKELVRCATIGSSRKAEYNKKDAELAKRGKARFVKVSLNGQQVLGKVVWNSEKTGLTAICNLNTKATVSVQSASSKGKSKPTLNSLLA